MLQQRRPGGGGGGGTDDDMERGGGGSQNIIAKMKVHATTTTTTTQKPPSLAKAMRKCTIALVLFAAVRLYVVLHQAADKVGAMGETNGAMARSDGVLEEKDMETLATTTTTKKKPLTQKQKELQWAYEKRKAARDNRKRGQEKEYAKENESMKSMSQAQRARLKTHGKENGDEGDDNDDDAEEDEEERENEGEGDEEDEEEYANSYGNSWSRSKNNGNWAEDSENPEDALVETFEPTPSKGGSFDFSQTKFAFGGPRCESWNVEDGDGPQVKIKRAVWIQTHGNNTAAQLKAAELNRKTGQRENAADKVYKSMRYHHAPSLARLPGGGFVAMWHAAPEVEGERSQHIRVSTSDHNGKSWSTSFKLKVPRRRAQWNPVIHVDSTGRVYVFYSESEGDCIKPTKPPQWPPGGSIKMTYTEDLKITEDSKWSTPKTIYSLDEDKSIPKMVSNNLIVLDDGKTWALPIWREHAGMATYAWPTRLAHCRVRNNRHGQKWTNTAEHSAGLLVSEDFGETWTARGYLEPAPYPDDDSSGGAGWSVGQKTTDLMDGSLFQSADEKKLSMYFKTTAGAIYGANSKDDGKTWSEPSSIGIDAPESKTVVQRLYFDGDKKGPLLMVYNAHKRSTITNAVGKEVRLPTKCITNMLLAVSPDDGETWVKIGAVRGTTTAPGLRFHSPSVVQSGCKLFVAYSKLYARGYQFSENDKDLGIRLVHINM